MSEVTARPGDVLGPVVVGPVAHGGHWVARLDGYVWFVRHALEGETVTLRVREVGKRFGRADVAEVLRASDDRVPAPCPIAGECGGCDFQHVAVGAQRELKEQVVAEQLRRLAGVDAHVPVEAADPDALGWRRRMRYHRAGDAWGLRAARSDTVVPLPPGGCRIAAPELAVPPSGAPQGDQVIGALSQEGVHWGDLRDATVLPERAAHRRWDVAANGFWQVHPQAADVLVEAVLEGLSPRRGETAADLYCGVGLFSGALVDAGVDVVGIEGSLDAVALARRNVPEARFVAGAVERSLRKLPSDLDLVVLDPPRTGAGRAVIRAVLERGPRAIAYVACDPAALARDLATALADGWRVQGLRAFDLFPMTHHVESVAILVR
ncbi:class I SAM-dependent RNA methyltransferase [Nigerium massiliense]|uniref:class I SAM-dependent RNA methyltransferase n=1 Tax=Nigerium massiliense TaxID=1522317 RepID=UPI00058C9A73|nr:TRAM domain-containing protein [Nigerium massiliense]